MQGHGLRLTSPFRSPSQSSGNFGEFSNRMASFGCFYASLLDGKKRKAERDDELTVPLSYGPAIRRMNRKISKKAMAIPMMT
jgi:hypothetical protein